MFSANTCAIPLCSVRTPVRYQSVQCEHLCDTTVFSVNTNAPVLGQHLCEHLCDTNLFSANTTPLCATICSVRALLVRKRYPRGFQVDFGPWSVSFVKLHSIQSSRLGSGFTAVVPLFTTLYFMNTLLIGTPILVPKCHCDFVYYWNFKTTSFKTTFFKITFTWSHGWS